MKLTLEKKIKFLDNVNSGMTKIKACALVGISRPTGDKWLQDFNANELPNVNFEDHVANHGSKTKKHKHHDEIIKLVLKFPNKGSEWFSKKLRENGIQMSTGSVFNSLKSSNLQTRAERVKQLFQVYNHDPENLDEKTIFGMESISPHFRDRRYTTLKPGELVFVFFENGYVSNSRNKIRFTIFLDSCGSMAFIEANIIRFLPKGNKSAFLSARQYDHAYLRPLKESKKIIYDFFGFRLKMICVSLKNNKDMHAYILQNQLKKMKIDVGALHVSDFNKISFIADFRKSFRNEFLRNDLKTIRHFRGREDTFINILNMTTEFIKKYNNSNIPSWPNMDKSPYQHVSDCTGKKIYLPSENEWLQKSK